MLSLHRRLRRRPRADVVLVTHEASRTGAPRVAVSVSQALVGAGHEVVVVVRWPGPLLGELGAIATEVVVEPMRRVRVALRRFRRSRRAAVELEVRVAHRVLDTLRPRVVVLNTAKSACYVEPAVALGIPAVLYVHESGDLLRDVLARYDAAALRTVVLAACSPSVAHDLSAFTGVSEDDITVIAPTVDPAEIERRASRSVGSAGPLVVACATADRGKGVDVWLEAASTLARRQPGLGARFVWLGDAAEVRRRRLPVPDNVEFLGVVENPYPWIAGADVFTLPSRSDSYPLVVLEALALGRPVVASAVGGVPMQVGDAGILVPPDDASALANAIAELLGNPAERARLGGLARARASRLLAPDAFRGAISDVVGRAARSH